MHQDSTALDELFPDWLSDEVPEPALPAAPTGPQSFLRELDDDTQEVASAPRTVARRRVAIRPVGWGGATVYGVEVRNTGARPIHAVLVEHEIPLGLRFLAADGRPSRRGRRLVWNLPSLAPTQSRRIRIRVAPTPEADVTPPAEAFFDIAFIHNPGVIVSVTGPRQLRLGAQAVLRLRVLNATDHILTGAKVVCHLSSATATGRTTVLETGLKRLMPGRTKVIDLVAEARKPGVLRCLATVVVPGTPDVSTRLEVRTDYGAALGSVAKSSPFPPGEPLEPPRPAAERHVVFGLGGNEYAVPMKQVAEVSRLPEFTPVPNVPDWVWGVANVRGDVVSLIDMRGLLGLPAPERPDRGRLLVVRSDDGLESTGLVVDRVVGMRALETRSSPPAGEEPLSPFLSGTASSSVGRWPLLDLRRLLLSPALSELDPLE